MEPILINRCRTQTAFLGQVIEEPRGDLDEGLRMVSSAGGLEADQHHRQHLFYLATDHRGGQAPNRSGACVVAGDPVGHELLNMSSQVPDRNGSTLPGELAEGDHDRYTAP